MAVNHPNSGEVLWGQKFFIDTGLTVGYTQQDHHDKKSKADYYGLSAVEINPIDGHQSRVITWQDPTTKLAQLSWKSHITVNLDLPPVLKSITTVYNKQKTEATSVPLNESVTVPIGGTPTTVNMPYGYSAGSSGGLRFNPRVSAKSSVMVAGDLQFVIEEVDARNVPATRYTFYSPTTASRSDVMTRLAALAGATVNQWPKFRPVARTFVVTAQEASVSLDLEARHIDDWSASSLSYSIEATKSVAFAGSVDNKTIRTPACINAGISIGSPTSSETAAVSAKVELPLITATGYAPAFGAYSHTDASKSVTATAAVSPTIINATTGATSIPTTGLYLLELVSTPDSWNHNRVTAVVVDFADV